MRTSSAMTYRSGTEPCGVAQLAATLMWVRVVFDKSYAQWLTH